MGAKLKIVFLVILAGVFFFPPDGADALKCVCNKMNGRLTNFTLQPCNKGAKGGEGKDAEGEMDCPNGVCYKTYMTDSSTGPEHNTIARGCVKISLNGGIPHLGCESEKTVTKFTTPENKTESISGTCYCNKEDLCNSVGQLRGMSLTQLSMSAIFVGVIVSRIGGIQ